MKSKLRKHIIILIAVSGILTSCRLEQHYNTIKIDGNSKELILRKAANVIPTERQMEALERGFIAFVHFGPNTFTGKEWGNGFETPGTFTLTELDTDQWCRAMKDAGMKMVIFTAKHHDGFVMWQSRYTSHGIMSTKFRNGKGDIMKDLSESCRKYGLKLGVYLSPADLYQIESQDGLYGNMSKPSLRTIPREIEGRPFENKTSFKFNVDDYNEYYLNQLFELLTEYGPISEVWLDGAHPKRKGGQTYNYHAWKELIRTLAPEANIFGREDIRWCGNEAGRTRDSEWNVVPYMENPDTLSQFKDMMDTPLAGREELIKGKWLHYQPAEVNTSIRDGWFWRDDTYQKTRSADDVFDIYERAVGGNSIFLLNIPPNRDGRFSQADVDVLEETGRRIMETYGTDLLTGAYGPKEVLDNDIDTYISLKDGGSLVIRLPEKRTINRIVLQEAIPTIGERAEKFAIDAMLDDGWHEIAISTNIGYKRILRFEDIGTDGLRFRLLESRGNTAISGISAHYSRYKPFHGNAFDAPQMLDYDHSLWKECNGYKVIDFGSPMNIHGIAYTKSDSCQDSSVRGEVLCSNDGANWKEVSSFDFGNLRNDSSSRYHYFHNYICCRYLRITAVPGNIELF